EIAHRNNAEPVRIREVQEAAMAAPVQQERVHVRVVLGEVPVREAELPPVERALFDLRQPEAVVQRVEYEERRLHLRDIVPDAVPSLEGPEVEAVESRGALVVLVERFGAHEVEEKAGEG